MIFRKVYSEKEENKWLIPYNLQYFADSGSGEKTEEPTARKKEKAREEGQVAKSTEITSAFLLLAMFAGFKIFGGGVVTDIGTMTRELYSLFGTETVDMAFASGLFNYVIRSVIFMLIPFFAISFSISLGTNLIQVGWHPTTKPLTPKLSRFNPIEGFKKIISLKSLVELVKSLMKIGLILAIVYNTIRDYESLIMQIYAVPFWDAYAKIVDICLDIGIRVGAVFMIIAAIDYGYQRYDLNKNLKMTKQEVKDEYKQTEGNPEIKQRIRQKMREAAMRRMMQDLPQADVIITNPTHFAVAIQYDVEQYGAPRVIAKGADLVAARIREKAKEHEIEIVENKPLARTLFYTVEIGDEIPQELYQVVAEILAMVYSMKEHSKEGA